MFWTLIAPLTQLAFAEAPDRQLDTEITDPTKDSNSVLVAHITPPKTYKTDCEMYRSLIEQYEWDSHIAFNIMVAESNCNPNALNNNPNTGDYSISLFQVNLYGGNANQRPSEDWLKVPENNIAYAYKIYLEQGWKAWGVCRKSVKCY